MRLETEIELVRPHLGSSDLAKTILQGTHSQWKKKKQTEKEVGRQY